METNKAKEAVDDEILSVILENAENFLKENEADALELGVDVFNSLLLTGAEGVVKTLPVNEQSSVLELLTSENICAIQLARINVVFSQEKKHQDAQRRIEKNVRNVLTQTLKTAGQIGFKEMLYLLEA